MTHPAGRNRLLIDPYGDSGLLVTARGGTAEQRWRTVHRLATAVRAGRLPGVCDVVATYDCLLVEFDCARTTFEDVAAALPALRPVRGATAPATVRVPVIYGGEHGPDLGDVAAQLGSTPEQVARWHAATAWTVRFRGAPAGAPMLDGPAFPSPVSRCPAPRVRVPGGSVAVAGRQSVIYPVPSPGGWRLIGRTPLRMVAIGRPPRSPYRPGDVIRFEPIDQLRFDQLAGHA